MLDDSIVRDAVVVVRQEEGQEPDLVAFVLVHVGDPSDEEIALDMETKIRQRLRTRLPSYMVPAQIIVMEELPTNASGKVDRKQLAQRAHSVTVRKVTSVRVARAISWEAILCEEFGDVLGVEVGAADNFFDLGGHSLLVTKLVVRLNHRLEIPVSIRDAFRSSGTCRSWRQGYGSSRVRRPRHGQLEHHTRQTTGPSNSSSRKMRKSFIQDAVSSQLSRQQGKILDIYPIHAWGNRNAYLRNPGHKTIGKPRALAPFYIDFPPDTDLTRLSTACVDLVKPIFGIFTDCLRGRRWQILSSCP